MTEPYGEEMPPPHAVEKLLNRPAAPDARCPTPFLFSHGESTCGRLLQTMSPV